MLKNTVIKLGCSLFAAALCAVILIPCALADNHSSAAHHGHSCSPWAAEEVDRASDADLLSVHLSGDLRKNVTRAQFCEMALQFTAAAQGYDIDSFLTLCNMYCTPVTPAFTDCDAHPNAEAACALGLVKGRGGGIFDPDSTITRQEAAVMLARVYKVAGLELPADGATFADEDAIADYALQSVNAVSALGVMNGTGENLFSPLTGYTGEQCTLTFLRLYENAALRAAEKPLFTQEQALAYVDSLTAAAAQTGIGFAEVFRAENEQATIVRLDRGGTMHAASRLLCVRADGAMRTLGPDVCLNLSEFDALTPALRMESPRFSGDGTKFLCEFTLPEDAYLYDAFGTRYLAHGKGTYLYCVDLQSGRESTGKL